MAPIARMPIQPPANLFSTPPAPSRSPSPPFTATTGPTDPTQRPHPATAAPGPTTKPEQVEPGSGTPESRGDNHHNSNNNHNNNHSHNSHNANNNPQPPQSQSQPSSESQPLLLQPLPRETWKHQAPRPEWTDALAREARDFYRQGLAQQQRRRTGNICHGMGVFG
ncbi:uncharacterized protein B0H64DRAFT_444371 [Chaetomium fimeti]|uniref:Uncharacterized protein n=1 Tax=Chaetomium fimeti TaxID=1854472 RepID=A0AAE0LPW6_9PEZI|nr:hypothetical protein B0H64DRAFT_444371 [Chaetomium fimeti]